MTVGAFWCDSSDSRYRFSLWLFLWIPHTAPESSSPSSSSSSPFQISSDNFWKRTSLEASPTRDGSIIFIHETWISFCPCNNMATNVCLAMEPCNNNNIIKLCKHDFFLFKFSHKKHGRHSQEDPPQVTAITMKDFSCWKQGGMYWNSMCERRCRRLSSCFETKTLLKFRAEERRIF